MNRRALAVGLGAVCIYAAGSWLSASLGTIGPPMLDGLAPPPPYRWVKPPADLAASNKDPFSGKFPVALTENGSDSAAFSTRDGQLTMVLSQGAIPAAPGQKSARVTVTPLDPATLGDPPSGLEITGNVYQIAATYRPGGDKVAQLAGGGDQRIVLVYPATAGGATHENRSVVQSDDGEKWDELPSQDAGAQQQVQAAIESLGYFAVAAPPEKTGLSTPALGIVILAGVLVILGALVIRRNMRRDTAPSSSRRP